MDQLQRIFRFYDNVELMTLPPQKWLIRDVLREDGVALLFGPPGEGKSFVALDWALCVATGKPWLDKHPVRQGHVVYIAAEGGGGIKRRVAAWQQFHCIKDVAEITWYLDTLNVFEEFLVDDEEMPGYQKKVTAVDLFMDQLKERFDTDDRQDIDTGEWTSHSTMDLRLVIIDTLSRNFGGEDENTSKMALFVERIEKFAKLHGALVLVVHHTNVEGKRERGHGSLKAATQASFRCTATKKDKKLVLVELDNNRQKDDPDTDSFYLTPDIQELHGLALDDGGKVLTSLVLIEGAKPDKKATVNTTSAKVTGPLTANQMFRQLVVSQDGMTDREWMIASGNSRASYYRKRNALKHQGLIEKLEGTSRWTPKDSAQDVDVDLGDEDSLTESH